MLRGRQTDSKLVADRTVGGLPLPYAATNVRYSGSAPKARAPAKVLRFPLERLQQSRNKAAVKAMRSHLGLLQDLRDDIARNLSPRRAVRRFPLISALLAGAALFERPEQPWGRYFPGYTRQFVCDGVPAVVPILAGTNCGVAVVTNSVGITGRPIVFRVWGPVIAEYPANPNFSYRAIAEAWKRDQKLGPPLTWTRPHVRQDLQFVPLPSVTVGKIVSDWPQDSIGSEPRRPAPQRNREVRVSGGRTRTVVRSDIARRPPRATKERKVRVALGASSIPGQIVAAMTEGIDVAQAFFRAMTDAQRADFWRREAAKNRAAKKECVRRNSTRQGVAACYAALPATGTLTAKLEYIARHFDTLDMGAVINEIAIMQAEDGWWGRLGKLEGAAAARRGQLTGGDFGARDMEPVTDDRTVVSGGEQIALREWLRRKYGD